jgi:hypothetical protein
MPVTKKRIYRVLLCVIVLLLVFRILPAFTTVSRNSFEDASKKQTNIIPMMGEVVSGALQNCGRRIIKLPTLAGKLYRDFLIPLCCVWIALWHLRQKYNIIDMRQRIANLICMYFQGSKYKGVHLTF